MNIFDMVNVLRAEKEAGIAMEAEMIERIDAHIRNYEAHIRDLQLFKVWVKDNMEVRHMALGGMLGMEPPEAPAPVLDATPQDEAA